MKDIFNAPLHEDISVGPASAMRVPGGWIYSNAIGGMTFVPWTKTTKAEEMREALEAVRIWIGAGMDSNEHFERLGLMFQRETGFLRPGKDEPPGCHYEGREEEKQKYWDLWIRKEGEAIKRRVMDALDMGAL